MHFPLFFQMFCLHAAINIFRIYSPASPIIRLSRPSTSLGSFVYANYIPYYVKLLLCMGICTAYLQSRSLYVRLLYMLVCTAGILFCHIVYTDTKNMKRRLLPLCTLAACAATRGWLNISYSTLMPV